MEGYRPSGLKEALEMRKKTGAVPYAGGTDLVVKYSADSGTPLDFGKPVLFLSGIKELCALREEKDCISIGSAVPMSALVKNPMVPPLLTRALLEIGAPGIRNLATLGGNICNASPAADSLPVLYILNAVCIVQSLEGIRKIPIEEFIVNPGTTVLKDSELLTEIRVERGSFSAEEFRKVGTRRANALSKVAFAGCAAVDKGRINDIRIAYGAAAPRVLRSREIENKLKGILVSDLKAQENAVLEDYNTLLSPISDQRSTEKYRRKTALRLLQWFFEKLAV